MPTLHQKALKCAIADIKKQITPKAANRCYKKWEAFHNNDQFKQAVADKQKHFQSCKKSSQ